MKKRSGGGVNAGINRWAVGATASSKVAFAGLMVGGACGNNYTVVTGQMYAFPFMISDPVIRQLTALSIHVTAANAALQFRMGLYAKSSTDGDVLPGDLLVDCGAQVTNSTGVWEFSVNLPYTLEPGVLYHPTLLCEVDGAPGGRTVARFLGEQMWPIYGCTRTAFINGGPLYGAYKTGVAAGGLPATFGAPFNYFGSNAHLPQGAIAIGLVLDPV